MLRSLVLALVLAFALLLPPGLAPAQDMSNLGEPPAGTYTLDKAHARLWFQVSHLGYSNYMAVMKRFDVTLRFDPADPAAMSVSARVDAGSLETFYPDPAFDFNAMLGGAEFFDVARFPEATFTSTAVTRTGAKTADVAGDLTLHGVTRPVTLAVTYNGGWGHMPLDPGGARIGFSATTVLKRSEFGMGMGVPTAEMPLGVGDEVRIFIEAELSNPDAPKP